MNNVPLLLCSEMLCRRLLREEKVFTHVKAPLSFSLSLSLQPFKSCFRLFFLGYGREIEADECTRDKISKLRDYRRVVEYVPKTFSQNYSGTCQNWLKSRSECKYIACAVAIEKRKEKCEC